MLTIYPCSSAYGGLYEAHGRVGSCGDYDGDDSESAITVSSGAPSMHGTDDATDSEDSSSWTPSFSESGSEARGRR